jgi:hypothetical protein
MARFFKIEMRKLFGKRFHGKHTLIKKAGLAPLAGV